MPDNPLPTPTPPKVTPPKAGGVSTPTPPPAATPVGPKNPSSTPLLPNQPVNPASPQSTMTPAGSPASAPTPSVTPPKAALPTPAAPKTPLPTPNSASAAPAPKAGQPLPKPAQPPVQAPTGPAATGSAPKLTPKPLATAPITPKPAGAGNTPATPTLPPANPMSTGPIPPGSPPPGPTAVKPGLPPTANVPKPLPGAPKLPGAPMGAKAPLPPGAAPTGLPPAGLPPAGTPPTGAPPKGLPPKAGAPAPATGATPAPSTSRLAQLTKSPLRLVPIILGALLVIGGLVFAATRFLGGSTNDTNLVSNTAKTPTTGGTGSTAKKTTITYWGLWEPTAVMEAVIADFEKANPDVDVQYVNQSPRDYRERLQTAIASGNGPDVFKYHASWVPMMKAELSPMPASVMSTTEFQQTFYPVMTKNLQVNGQIVGVPLAYEGLALYYNKQMLQAANAQPPTTWAELRTLATQLTVRSGTTIERGGLAIGNAENVEHFADIIGLLMLQNGANPANPTSTEARDALTFYTNFVKVDKVWSPELPNSTVAFAREDAAMMFAPSWRAHEIKAINPDLDFGIAPLPKLSETHIAWANYWAEGVSAQSKQKDAAWRLLKYLSSKEGQQKLHAEQSKVRTFGTVYSRVDLANTLATDPYLSAFVTDAPKAQSWYLNTYTHDNGLNDQLIKYYEDAITAVLGGKDATSTLQTVNQGTTQVLRQYNVTTTSSTTGSGTSGGTTGTGGTSGGTSTTR